MSSRNGPFKGRTVAVVNDLSLDEQRYLYRKAGELKRAVQSGGEAREFRLNDNDYSVYLIFMEDSTRTRESFHNAAKFLGARTNLFDTATSSFNKNESMSDAIKMLYGYSDESCYVIRSKLEGVCRWLEDALGRYADSGREGRGPPSSTPATASTSTLPRNSSTSTLSSSRWAGRDERIHIALTGDLYHGRTIHSKANGLRALPRGRRSTSSRPRSSACPRITSRGCATTASSSGQYESLDEYLASGKVAPIWYFTRLQLERMGDEVLEKAPALRASVTFRKDMIGLLPEGCRFYHPLPRDRTARPTRPSSTRRP